MSFEKIKVAEAALPVTTRFKKKDTFYYPKVEIKYLRAQKNWKKSNSLIRELKKLPKISNPKSVNWSNIDILFTSLPTGESRDCE